MEKAPGPRYMSHYWHENPFMVVQGPALSKEPSLLWVVPVDFKTSGRTNNVLQPSLPPSGHLPAWGTRCQDTLLIAALGGEMSGRSTQEWVLHEEMIPAWPPTAPAPPHPGWDCDAGEGGFTCLGLFCRRNEPNLPWAAHDCLQVLFSPTRGEWILRSGWLVDSLFRNFRCMATFSCPSRCGCWAWQPAATSNSCWRPQPPAKGNMKKVLHQNEIINCRSPVCSFKRCMSVYIKPFAGYWNISKGTCQGFSGHGFDLPKNSSY